MCSTGFVTHRFRRLHPLFAVARRRGTGHASRATRKRRSGGPGGQAGAVPAISAPTIGIQLRGQGRRAPFPTLLPGPAAGFFEGRPSATGEEPGGSIVSVRIVRPLARGGAVRSLGCGLRPSGGGRRTGEIVDAGRDTQVARDRRWRATAAGGGTFPDEVGPAARGGRCGVGRRLRSAKVPASPYLKTYPVVKQRSLAGSRGVGFAVRPDRIAWVTARAPDASFIITGLACGQLELVQLDRRRGWHRRMSSLRAAPVHRCARRSPSCQHVGKPDTLVTCS